MEKSKTSQRAGWALIFVAFILAGVNTKFFGAYQVPIGSGSMILHALTAITVLGGLALHFGLRNKTPRQ